MRDRLGRRRALKNHPGLSQVDRLLASSPDELEVPISGLPGQLAALYSIYEGLFELRDYRVKAVDRRLDDLWIARFTRKRPTAELVTGQAHSDPWEGDSDETSGRDAQSLDRLLRPGDPKLWTRDGHSRNRQSNFVRDPQER